MGRVWLSACPHCGGTHLGLSTASYNPNMDCENEYVAFSELGGLLSDINDFLKEFDKMSCDDCDWYEMKISKKKAMALENDFRLLNMLIEFAYDKSFITVNQARALTVRFFE